MFRELLEKYLQGNNKVNVRAIAQGSSELNITFIIERKDCKKAVNVLYDAFINQK